MTLAHCGLFVISIGTIVLAYAIRFENKHTLSARTKEEKKYMEKIVSLAQDGSYWEPSVVIVKKPFFYGGLIIIIIGTFMQW